MDVNTAKKDYQRLSASRFSVASSYGKPGQLEELATDGHTLFSNRLIEYKNTIVNAYHSRDFEKIYPCVQVCEMQEQSIIWPYFKIAKTILFV